MIFGVISTGAVSATSVRKLAKHAEQRGRDSSGLLCLKSGSALVHRADHSIMRLLRQARWRGCAAVLGHSSLITKGLEDNQPVVRDGVCVFHNGIVVNHANIWGLIGESPRQQIDTEVIAAIAARHPADGGKIQRRRARIGALRRCGEVCARDSSVGQALPLLE